jgi:hypothetical protein
MVPCQKEEILTSSLVGRIGRIRRRLFPLSQLQLCFLHHKTHKHHVVRKRGLLTAKSAAFAFVFLVTIFGMAVLLGKMKMSQGEWETANEYGMQFPCLSVRKQSAALIARQEVNSTS